MTEYKATLTITSHDDSGDVQVEIKWDPDMQGLDIQELGFYPASYQFVEQYVLPALEKAYFRSEYAELLETESPSDRIN